MLIVAAILTAAFMMEMLGEMHVAEAIRAAVTTVVSNGIALTPDAGGTATTEQVGDAITAALSA